MTSKQQETILRALDSFAIETPSWGYANTGTRFGKFLQAVRRHHDRGEAAGRRRRCTSTPAAARPSPSTSFGISRRARLDGRGEATRGEVRRPHRRDQPECVSGPDLQARLAGQPRTGGARRPRSQHILDCVEIQHETGSRDLSLWFADGTNYPGHGQHPAAPAVVRRGAARRSHAAMRPGSDARGVQAVRAGLLPHRHRRLGHGLLYAKRRGPRAKVLVDTGHHYQAQNIEQIVAWLLDENMLGGFHFNDRRYADDDLTLGSIDPYQVFRIFYEISLLRMGDGSKADIAYMVDQSHNLKNKIEEMIQTVDRAGDGRQSGDGGPRRDPAPPGADGSCFGGGNAEGRLQHRRAVRVFGNGEVQGDRSRSR